ncbi:MAG: heparinase II/III family protein, partial [Pseudomonadota bacterium]
VAWYRFGIASGRFRRLLPVHAFSTGPLLAANAPPEPHGPQSQSLKAAADQLIQGRFPVFTRQVDFDGQGDGWFFDHLNDQPLGACDRHWTRISDFNPGVDIKGVWELSRFKWALTLARAARAWGSLDYLISLNALLDSWRQRNPANAGPNWKCGQEASIRLLHFLLVLKVLDQEDEPTASAVEFVERHCERIAPSVDYARAQDNNHYISESVALYAAGLSLSAWGSASGPTLHRNGRDALERAVDRLIGQGGDFSQYSTVYHRLMLNTLVVAEVWRRHYAAPAWSSRAQDKAGAATRWLAALTDPASGDAANLGANDGADEYRLSESSFRDFRPVVQTASRLFCGRPVYPSGPWDEPSHWLGLDMEVAADDGARMGIRNSDSFSIASRSDSIAQRVVVRNAHCRFRPSHADAFHVDYWTGTCNLLRDSGTYSYAVDTETYVTLAGTGAHNTVQFGEQDQMPRLGRFLFGRWFRGDATGFQRSDDGLRWEGQWTDMRGNRHARTLLLTSAGLTICDDVHPTATSAVLRWRLAPADWQCVGTAASSAYGTIELEATGRLVVELEAGIESRHYGELSAIHVLVAHLGREPCRVITHVRPTVIQPEPTS